MIQPNTPPFTNGTEEAQERCRIFQGPTVISATEAGLKSRPSDFSPMLPLTRDRAGRPSSRALFRKHAPRGANILRKLKVMSTTKAAFTDKLKDKTYLELGVSRLSNLCWNTNWTFYQITL